MTLNGQTHSVALWCRKDAYFGARCTNLNEDRPIHAATKMQANDSSFWKYRAYVDTLGGSSWRGPQMRLGLLTTAIFGDLSGRYFFGDFRYWLRPTILYDDMLPLVGLLLITK